MSKRFEKFSEGITLIYETLADGSVVHSVHIAGWVDIQMVTEREALELAAMLAKAVSIEGWSV